MVGPHALRLRSPPAYIRRLIAPLIAWMRATTSSSLPAQMAVPMLDLKRQYQPLHAELLDAVARVLETQQFILGEPVAFRARRSRATGSKARHRLLFRDGRAVAGAGGGWHRRRRCRCDHALQLFASVSAILRAGATPELADIDPATFNLAPKRFVNALNARNLIPLALSFPFTSFLRPGWETMIFNGRSPAESRLAEWLRGRFRVRAASHLATIGFFRRKRYGQIQNLCSCGIIANSRHAFDEPILRAANLLRPLRAAWIPRPPRDRPQSPPVIPLPLPWK